MRLVQSVFGVFLLGTTLWLVPPAYAALIVTIGDAESLNAVPFNPFPDPDYPSTRYQEIYNSSLFPNKPFMIQEIAFFSDPTPTSDIELFGTRVAPATYEIRFSTTNKLMDGLDNIDFDANLGADNVLFFLVKLDGDPLPPAELLSIQGNSYLYDPSQGNLLLDMRITERTGLGRGYFLNDKSGTEVSRAQNFVPGGFEGYGLVTRFTGEVGSQSEPVVPEPSSFILLGAGLLGLFGSKRQYRA